MDLGLVLFRRDRQRHQVGSGAIVAGHELAPPGVGWGARKTAGIRLPDAAACRGR